MPFDDVIASEAELREVYRQPAELTQRKKVGSIDEHCRGFIELSPFVLIGTAAADGTADVSPKGGPPGFVVTLDEHRLAIPDLSGNNLLDSITNLLHSPAVGLLFLIPGLDETLRVNGRGCITRDPDVLAACEVKDRRPTAAIGVEVQEAFVHCAKAFRRGGVWAPDTWLDREDLPSAACMLRDHIELADVPVALIEEDLERGYAASMWEPGG